MKISRLVVLACLAGACTSSGKKEQAGAEKETPPAADETYVPFPDGYGYMQDTAGLNAAVKAGKTGLVRDHAWKLWAGIMQPDAATGWPLWNTWPNSQEAFAAGTAENLAAIDNADSGSGSLKSRSLRAMRGIRAGDDASVFTPAPVYRLPEAVMRRFPKSVQGDTNIISGRSFLFNGDIMIATESLSKEGFDWIRDNDLNKQAKLNSLHRSGEKGLNAPPQYIVTKHMYWPVAAKGLSAIPVWNDDFPATFTGYAGYEKWKDLIAVDPSGRQAGQTATVSYLHGVLENDGKTPMDSVTRQAKVYGLENFYHHRVTAADWAAFSESDKAIINASSYWAYNKPFGPGDYLVTIAMHINTKEVPTWALQSAWWSDTPDAGQYAMNRPDLPQAKGPWKHYKMVEAYGIVDRKTQMLPVGTNPYIELVSHPVATNCNNCHQRAGWPEKPVGKAGIASYQNPDCPNLLAPLTPASPCLQKILLSDFQWIIPDRAVGLAAKGKK